MHPSYRTFFAIVLAIVFALIAPTANAQIGIVDHCLSTATPVGFPTGIAVCPDGDGETLADKGARIDLQVLDALGFPLANIPAVDIWLIGCTNELVLCGGSASSNADANTNANGETTISGTIAAGGADSGVRVVVQGIVLSEPDNCGVNLCLDLGVRSADSDGDLLVNMVDVANFALAFPPNAYLAAADYNFDGIIGLADLAFFAQHFPHICL